jgi:sulfide:quinone oxidoreductase
VVVLGGGVAGVEAVLALNDLAPEQTEVTLVSADRDFILKPLAVEEPFSGEPPERHDLDALMSELGGRFVQARATAVRPSDHVVELESEELGYDALLVALGARMSAPLEDARVLHPTESLAVDDAIREAAASPEGKLAVVIPSGGGAAWPLPAYELALMTGRRAKELGAGDLTIELVTPEERPLGAFGVRPADAVAQLLRERGIALLTATRLEQQPGGKLVKHPGGEAYAAGSILALPLLHGPALDGLPHDQDGFIPIDGQARVVGTEDVWAAGDGTNFPIKQGGLAAAEADAAAEDIAQRHGAEVEAKPFDPVLRGQLLTGSDSLHLSSRAGVEGAGTASADALWWPPGKVVGRYLPSILEHEGIEFDPSPPREALDVEAVVREAEYPGAPRTPMQAGDDGE